MAAAARVMGDSVSPLTAIPPGVQIAAFYLTGGFAVTEAQIQGRFPHQRYGWCAIDATGSMPAAQARDWETGDKAGNLEQWVISHNKASGRRDAVIYCNRATIPEVRRLTGGQILGRDYFLWIATLDGTLVAPGADHLDAGPLTYPGVVACQLKGAQLTGGDWDQSLVFDASLWTPTAPPLPPLVSKAQAVAAVAGAQLNLAVLTRMVAEMSG
jgi:hypothetical protein